MSPEKLLRHFPWRPARMPLALTLFFLAGVSVHAATIVAGDVTATLGPTFFVDDAVIGGSDTAFTQPAIASYNRSFAGLLNPDQGSTRITLTGFGFASSAATNANTATALTVSFTYLGADGAIGGGDDVFIGSATGTYVYSGAGEYVFAFDAPLTVDLNITDVRFLIQVAPSNGNGNGSVLFKTAALTYETASGPKFSVSGFVMPPLPPPRVNLAKYQPVITDSVNGQQLSTYVTDGVVGNDNRWQSSGSGPHWAQVVFPFPVQVGSAQVFSGLNDGSAMAAYKLQYLNNSSWVDVPGASVSGNANVENNLVFTTPVTASAFRLYDSVDGTVRLKELALYPPNGASGYPMGTDLTLNLAYSRPALATANTAGNFALLAVDGRANPASMWQTSLAGSNALSIDLRVSTKIGSAHLYSGSPGVAPLSDFVLRYWNGSAWQDIPGGSVAGNTSSSLVIPFTGGVTTSNVLLVFTNSGLSSVQELCIFPANNNGGYPLGTGVISAPPSTARFDDYNDAFYNLSNSAANRFIANSNGVPVLNSPGQTTAQGQYQVLLNISTGTYRLCNRATGNCLAGAQLSTNAGDLLVDEPYAALPDQDWILEPIDGTHFYLVNQWSGLVIDTLGGGTDPGTPLVQSVNTGAASQRWQMVYATGFPKKGIGGSKFALPFNANWAYNWGLTLGASTVPDDTMFDPMQWGSFNWNASTPNPSIWKLYSAWRTTAGALHLLGFNEPDTANQSNIYDTNAVALWPRLQAMDVPLVSPAPANLTGGWLATFYTLATNLGYRVDYTASHEYINPGGGSSDGLVNILQTGYANWGRPMWMTEFGFVDWSGTSSWSEEDNYNALAEFLWRAESLPWLRKYALFVFTADTNNPIAPQPWTNVTPAPRSNAYDTNGNFTPFGELYAAWDNDANVETNKAYYIHNKNTRKRLANTLDPALPNAKSIRTSDVSVRWTLVPAPGSGLYYVVSALDGRRLSYVNAGSVSLVAAGTTGSAVQWGLTQYQYGWFYLEHPATSKRLQLAYNNSTGVATFSMVANTTTSDAVRWRFIVPLPPPAWTGASDTSWTTAGNWTPAGVPAAGYGVMFNSASTANLNTVLNQDFNLLGLTVTAPSGPVAIAGTNSLTLGGGGIDLSGASQNLAITAPMVLGSDQSWNVAGGQALTVDGGVSGSSALTVMGAGTVSLGGPGTYSGDTTINTGSTLEMRAANVLPNGANAGNLIVNGTLDLNGYAEAINGLSGSGIVDNAGGGTSILTVGNNAASGTANTFAGTLQNSSGTLALVKTGGGSLKLSGTNTFSGGFTNNGAGSVNSANPAGTNYCFGTGPVVLNAGTLYLTTTNWIFTNALALNGGTLRLGGGASKSLAWIGPVSVTADSTIQSDGSTTGITLSGGMTNAGFTLTCSANGTATTISGPISGLSGTIVAGGFANGILNLNAANPFGGTNRAALGTLKIGNLNALQNATLDLNALDSGTVNLNNLNATIGALTGSRNLTLGNGTVSIGKNNLSTLYEGVLSGNGALTKIGTGTLMLDNASTYAGNTLISAGTLALSGSGGLASPNIIVAGGAMFDVSAQSPSFTLSGRTLTNGSAGAMLNGANNCSGGTLALVYNGVNPAFLITNGTMLLSGSTVIQVNNTGASLGAGSHTLIAAATTGNAGLVTGTLPPVTLTGGGATGAISLQLNGAGGLDLVVASSMTTNPTNIACSVSSGTLTLTWPEDHLGWIAQSNSMNLANPGCWFDIPGSQSATNLVIPISSGDSNVFYRLRYPN